MCLFCVFVGKKIRTMENKKVNRKRGHMPSRLKSFLQLRSVFFSPSLPSKFMRKRYEVNWPFLSMFMECEQ